MFVLRLIWLFILVFLIPTVIGTLFWKVDHRSPKWIFGWISGQMLLWAGFELIAVPLILMKADFQMVVALYSGYQGILLFAAVAMDFSRMETRSRGNFRVIQGTKDRKWTEHFFWCLFLLLLLFQILQSFRLAYGDGDDAYYVATSGITESSDTMYRIIAYTGGETGLELRYGLAPLPIWIAYLSRLTGIRSISVALVFVPPVLIAMTYAVYALVGSKLFGKRREYLPLFLIFIELMILFGNYSFYTTENFLLARSRQGKAALGNLIIPMLFFLLFVFAQNLQEQRKPHILYWILFPATLTSACLCSTMGGLLAGMLVGIAGLCMAVCYKQWKFLIPMAASCIPCITVALLYMRMG